MLLYVLIAFDLAFLQLQNKNKVYVILATTILTQ